jgi:hypothetical protein
MEDKYKKEMRSLEKVSAPGDFLEQVHARINRFERIKKILFVPAQIKIPLELAAVVTTIIVAFTVYKGILPPTQIAYKAPETKVEMAAKIRPEVKGQRLKARGQRPKVVEEDKPIEIALLIKADEAVMDEGPEEAIMGMAAAPSSMKAGKGREVERSVRAPSSEPSYVNENLAKIKNLIKLSDGKVISVDYDKESGLPQYITAEIPAKNYAAFLEKLAKLGDIQKPLPSKALRLRIKLVPPK